MQCHTMSCVMSMTARTKIIQVFRSAGRLGKYHFNKKVQLRSIIVTIWGCKDCKSVYISSLFCIFIEKFNKMNGVNPKTTILTPKGVNFYPYYFGEYSAATASGFQSVNILQASITLGT